MDASGVIVAAWGASIPSVYPRRDHAVLRRIAGRGPAYCLGVTASGAPRHPLYLRSDAPLVLFPVPV